MPDSALRDLEDAERAYLRIRPELEALPVADLAPLNVDLVTATSVVIGVSERILAYRDRIAKLAEFEIRHVDNLVDYAKAAWYAYVTNLPAPEQADSARLIMEVVELRSMLLLWAAPLVSCGLFEANVIAKIKQGSGNKDAASDLVALVSLYRSKWEEVGHMCGVKARDLERGAEIGPAMFALISRREFQAASLSDGMLRVRRAWTLLERSYRQCQRAVAFLLFDTDDPDTLVPSLRRNLGPRTPRGRAT
jgi:hypothetical protein